MAETAAESSLDKPKLPVLSDTIERHQKMDGDPAVVDQLGQVLINVRKAIDLTVAPDPTQPELPIHRGREEKLLSLLTGMEELSKDPYGLGGGVPRALSPNEAGRLAGFIREVSKLGRVNEDDGSVTLYTRPDNGATGPITVSPKRP